MRTVQAVAVRPSEPCYRLMPQGMVVADEMTESEYDRAGIRIGQIVHGSHWAIGDWLAYGQERGFATSKFETAHVLTGVSFAVLSQSLRVSKAYIMDERVAGLSWTHHRAALALPMGERTAALQRALAEQWTANMVVAFVTSRQEAMTQGIPLARVASPVRDNPHRAGVLRWQGHRKKRYAVFRKCPKCGHRWNVRTTKEQ